MKHSNELIKLLTVSGLLLILSACQSTPTVTQKPSIPAPSKTVDKTYSQPDVLPVTATTLPDGFQLTDANDDFQLRQAASLFQTGSPGLALDMLDSIENGSLTPDQRTRKRIMQAAILLQAGGSLQAQKVLHARLESFQPQNANVFYLMRARSFMARGDSANALKSLIARGQYLTVKARQDNQLLIWNVLMISDSPQLSAIQQTDMTAELAGWIELAAVIKASRMILKQSN